MSSEHTHPTKRRLFLLRHALALPATSGQSDISRALSPQGIEDAAALGLTMKYKAYTPDCILCSTSVRTRQTLDALKTSLPACPIEYLDRLYDGGTDAYETIIQRAPTSTKNLLIVAHNPCIGEYANRITGHGRDALRQRLSEGYRPATLTVLNIELEDWALLSHGQATIQDLLDPLDYNAPARPTRWM